MSTGDFPLAGDKVNLADNAVTTRVKSMRRLRYTRN